MNKLYISLLALATLSSAAYANDRGYDVRDSDTCMGKYCNNVKKPFTSTIMTEVSPLAVDENAQIDQFRAYEEDLQRKRSRPPLAVQRSIDGGRACSRPFCLTVPAGWFATPETAQCQFPGIWPIFQR